jgi:hypothetical protein
MAVEMPTTCAVMRAATSCNRSEVVSYHPNRMRLRVKPPNWMA